MAVVLQIPLLKAFNGIEAVFRTVGNIFAPVIDVQDRLFRRSDHHNRNHPDCEHRADASRDTARLTPSSRPFCFFLYRPLNSGSCVDQVCHDQQCQNREEDDGGQSVHLRRHGLLCHIVNADRQCLETVSRSEIADDKVIQTQCERHDHTCDNTGHNLRDFNLQKRPGRRASQVHGCFRKRTVHLLQLRQHLQDHIGQTESYMRNQHGPEVQTGRRTEQSPDKHEHQHQGDTSDDIRVDHRNICYGIHGCAHCLVPKPVNAHRCRRTHDGGNDGSRKRQDQRITDSPQSLRIPEEFPVPVEAAAGKYTQAFRFVE